MKKNSFLIKILVIYLFLNSVGTGKELDYFAKSIYEEFKDNLPSMSENSISEEKYLDEYSKDDLQKLNDILKSVEKK